MDRVLEASSIKAPSTRDTKHGFDRLIDLARAEVVAVAKHGRPVAVMAMEQFDQPKLLESVHVNSRPTTTREAE